MTFDEPTKRKVKKEIAKKVKVIIRIAAKA
jgi:hypothetical protein